MWKRTSNLLGLLLFLYSFIAWGAIALLPFLPFSSITITALGLIFAVSAEMAFLASVALLGKSFFSWLKQHVIKGIQHLEPRPPQEKISYQRHRVGVVLFVLSTLSTYFVIAVPFLHWFEYQRIFFTVAFLLLSEALFLISLLVLGAPFWEKLNHLFTWENGRTSNDP